MPIARNVWKAGQDELLNFLTRQDADKRLAEDRAQKDKAYQDAQAQISIANAQRDRVLDTDSQRVAADIKRNELRDTEELATKARRKELLAVLQNPETDKNTQRETILELESLGVPTTYARSLMTPEKPETRPVMRVNPRTGKVEPIGDVPANAHFVNEPAPPREPSVPKASHAQILQAKRSAVNDARAAYRDPLNAPQIPFEEYAAQLEDDYMAALGVEPTARRPKAAPTVPDPAKDPMMSDVPSLGKRATPGAARKDTFDIVAPNGEEMLNVPAAEAQVYLSKGAKIKGQ